MTVSRWHMTDEEWKAHREFQLTPGEARAFVNLRAAGPECVPNDRIHVDTQTRSVLIHNLRNKVQDYGFLILNVYGVGYRLTEVKKAVAA